MADWWTVWSSYRLANFMMFSPQVHDRMLEAHNQALWPAQILALAVGAGVLSLMLLRPADAGRLVSGVLGVAWLWVAWTFLAQRYAEIHLGGKYLAAAFALQGVLLLWTGIARAGLSFERGPAARSGALVFAFALLFWPLLALLFERPWAQAQVFAIVPDPTALATLGVLLASSRTRPVLVPIPLAWCAFSAATWWGLGQPDALLVGTVALFSVLLLPFKRML
jgi:hypothetical protein